MSVPPPEPIAAARADEVRVVVVAGISEQREAMLPFAVSGVGLGQALPPSARGESEGATSVLARRNSAG